MFKQRRKSRYRQLYQSMSMLPVGSIYNLRHKTGLRKTVGRPVNLLIQYHISIFCNAFKDIQTPPWPVNPERPVRRVQTIPQVYDPVIIDESAHVIRVKGLDEVVQSFRPRWPSRCRSQRHRSFDGNKGHLRVFRTHEGRHRREYVRPETEDTFVGLPAVYDHPRLQVEGI